MYEQNPIYRQYSLGAPGISTGLGNTADVVLSMLLGNRVIPQLSGNNSMLDMMMQRSRNLDMHSIMQAGFANSQIAARMGFNPDSMLFKAMAPMIAAPNSPVMQFMSPFIGGNPVQAQMGLYADLTGYANAGYGRIGNISAPETTQLMQNLQQQFYKKPNFGEYQQQVLPALNRTLGAEGVRNISWTPSGLRNFERTYGVSGVAGELADLASTTNKRIAGLNITDPVLRNEEVAKIKADAKATADALTSEISKGDFKNTLQKNFAELNEKALTKMAGDPAMRAAARMIGHGVDIASGKIPGAIDFSFTRGFNLEDLTQAFGMAGGLNLSGRKGGYDINKFVSSSVGTLDAARGIFGRDLSGKELMASLDGLLGSSYVDMTSPGDSQKFEEALRRIKSTARVAGVGVEVLKGVIDEVKAVTGLGFNVGKDIALRTEPMVMAATASMDPRTLRMMGGVPGVRSSLNGLFSMGMNEPITDQLSAMYAMVDARMPGDAGAALKKQISDYATGGASKTRAGFNMFLNQMAPALGMSSPQLATVLNNNAFLSAKGKELAPQLGQAGTGALMQGAMQELGLQMGDPVRFADAIPDLAFDASYEGMSDGQLSARLAQKFGIKGLSAEKLQRARGIVTVAANKRKAGIYTMGLDDITTGAGIGIASGGKADMFFRSGGSVLFNSTYNKSFSNIQNTVNSLISSGATLDSVMSADLAPFNSRLTTRLFQSALSGNWTTDASNQLSSVVGGTSASQIFDKLKNGMEMTSGLTGASTDEARRAAILKYGAGITDKINSKNFDDIMFVGRSMGDSGLTSSLYLLLAIPPESRTNEQNAKIAELKRTIRERGSGIKGEFTSRFTSENLESAALLFGKSGYTGDYSLGSISKAFGTANHADTLGLLSTTLYDRKAQMLYGEALNVQSQSGAQFADLKKFYRNGKWDFNMSDEEIKALGVSSEVESTYRSTRESMLANKNQTAALWFESTQAPNQGIDAAGIIEAIKGLTSALTSASSLGGTE